jgi:16S rRNA (adenine1518-N6/adenine1519-N6)-dimethyltransferase
MTTSSRPPRRKALGQHHLRDEGLCRPAVDFLSRSAPNQQDAPVVEIGPGGGVLTAALLRSGRRVIALELDRGWALHLRREALARDWTTEAQRGRRLTLAVADALAVDWSRLPQGAAVAGNLPYQISTVLIEQLLDRLADGAAAVFLVQREVAERMVAPPGTAAYGSFSVLVQARCRVELLARVRPGSFVPPPRVESAFVGLRFGPPPLPREEWSGFKATVRAAFGARRKILRNSLAVAWGRETAERTLEGAGLAWEVRAEALDQAAFVRLWRARAAQQPVVKPA